MREIKFRAWDGSIKQMVIPNAVHLTGGNPVAEWHDFSGGLHLSNMPGSDVTLMQYTGLKDKNGVEIYEADVVRYNTGETWLAGWNAREAGFVFKNGYIVDELGRRKPSGIGYGQNPGMHEVEVIGNIYENPELLENE